MTKQRLDLPHALYYVELKASGQRPLFPQRSLFEDFRERLSQWPNETDSQLLAYCLLQTSVHLVVRAGSEGVQADIGKLEQAYTQHHNQQQDRHGSVFHKHTPCVLLEPRPYLAQVIKQLHQLPVDQGLVASPAIYPWSSHRAYTDEASCAWLDTDTLLNQLSQQRASKIRRYAHFMQANSPVSLALAQGNHPQYQAWASSCYIEKLLAKPSETEPRLTPTLAWLENQVCIEYGLGLQDLRLWRRHRLAREVKAVIALLAQQLGTATVHECAEPLGEDAQQLFNGIRNLEASRALYLYAIEQRIRQRLRQQAVQEPGILQAPPEPKAVATAPEAQTGTQDQIDASKSSAPKEAHAEELVTACPLATSSPSDGSNSLPIAASV